MSSPFASDAGPPADKARQSIKLLKRIVKLAKVIWQVRP